MIFLFLALFALKIASSVFLWNHIEIEDIENSLYAFFQTYAILCAIRCTISIGCHRTKVRKVFDLIHSAVDKRLY